MFEKVRALLIQLVYAYRQKDRLNKTLPNLWKGNKHNWKLRYPLYIYTTLDYTEVCGLFEVLFALDTQNYSFFARETDTIIFRMRSYGYLTTEAMQEYRNSLYAYDNVEIWIHGLHEYFFNTRNLWASACEELPPYMHTNFIMHLAYLPLAYADGDGDGRTPRVGDGDGRTPRVGDGDGRTPRVGDGDGKTPRVGDGDGKTPRVGDGDGVI